MPAALALRHRSYLRIRAQRSHPTFLVGCRFQHRSFTRVRVGIAAQRALSAEDTASLKQQADAQRALVARLRTLKPTGRIVLEMPENAAAANLPDIALEDGDRLFIPKLPSMVNVFGTVFNESAFLFSPDKQVNDYLALAGGPRKQADERSIYLLRANGSVVSSRQWGILAGSISG